VTAVCSACGGDAVHVGSYPAGPGRTVTGPTIEVGLCLACGEALRLVARPEGTVVAEQLVPHPT